MNGRRGFFRTVFGGLAVAAVGPKVLAAQPKPLTEDTVRNVIHRIPQGNTIEIEVPRELMRAYYETVNHYGVRR